MIVTAPYQPPNSASSAGHSLRSASGSNSTSAQGDVEPISLRSRTMAAAGPRSYAPRNDRGCIYHATKLLEQKNGAFFISRLILASGINLRTYDLNTYDDPVAVAKFVKSLRSMLSESDLDTLLVQTGLSANLR